AGATQYGEAPALHHARDIFAVLRLADQCREPGTTLAEREHEQVPVPAEAEQRLAVDAQSMLGLVLGFETHTRHEGADYRVACEPRHAVAHVAHDGSISSRASAATCVAASPAPGGGCNAVRTRARPASVRVRAGPSSSSGRSAPASASGVAAPWMNSGASRSPATRLTRPTCSTSTTRRAIA